jgi:hypothetical protein
MHTHKHTRTHTLTFSLMQPHTHVDMLAHPLHDLSGPPTDRLYVFFPENPKVSTEDIGSYFKKMQEGHVKRGIIAFRDKITPMARTAIAEVCFVCVCARACVCVCVCVSVLCQLLLIIITHTYTRSLLHHKTHPPTHPHVMQMKPMYTLEQFNEVELMVNITEHMYVTRTTVHLLFRLHTRASSWVSARELGRVRAHSAHSPTDRPASTHWRCVHTHTHT